VAGAFGDVRGVIPDEPEPATDWVLAHPWPTSWTIMLVGVGLIALTAAFLLIRNPADESEDAADAPIGPRLAKGALTTALFAAPVLVALVGRDLSWVTDARPQGYEHLIHLFVYNYDRPWPEVLDYRPVLSGFAVVATSLILVAAFRPLRDVAVRAFLGAALLFTAWTLDVYMIDLSPHWGQRELFETYYRERTGPEQPVLAYQMTWKGENFDPGNRVNVFVQLDNRALRNWAAQHSGETVFVVLERARLGGLRSAMRNAEIEEITDDRLCNKFILIRATIPGAQPTPPSDIRQ
jgi:hypothetical protein